MSLNIYQVDPTDTDGWYTTSIVGQLSRRKYGAYRKFPQCRPSQMSNRYPVILFVPIHISTLVVYVQPSLDNDANHHIISNQQRQWRLTSIHSFLVIRVLLPLQRLSKDSKLKHCANRRRTKIHLIYLHLRRPQHRCNSIR